MDNKIKQSDRSRFFPVFFKFFILPFVAAIFINAVIIFNAPQDFVYSSWGKRLDYVIVLLCYSYTIYKPVHKYFRQKKSI